MQSSLHKTFFLLVKAGLFANTDFEREEPKDCGPVDWYKVWELAQEQSVQGLVLAGIETIFSNSHRLDIPQALLLQWIGEIQVLEQRNKAMNFIVADLIEKLRSKDVYAILVKGQGIAQCYEMPLWRACGDIDLLMSESNYSKSVIILNTIATHIDKEIAEISHQAMKIGDWDVDLHGSLRTGLWKRLDKTIDDIQYAVFYEGKVRSWMNGNTQVFMPQADEDIVFVFTHILQHFFKGGIGLRQICDLCRLIWTYRSVINVKLLDARLKSAGVISEWKAFAAFAVEYLGMPIDAIPLYSNKQEWVKKAERILALIIETGNFGHNRDVSYYSKYPFLVQKSISLWRYTKDSARQFLIFPIDSIKVWFRILTKGIRDAIRQSREHE